MRTRQQLIEEMMKPYPAPPLPSPGVLDYFPLEKIRPIQEEALLGVFKAFESGKKFVFLEAPAGTGKSALAVTLAHYYRSTYILTKTIQLQTQYANDFKAARVLKGRRNFDCVRGTERDPTCAGVRKDEDEDDESDEDEEKTARSACPPTDCPYRVAKARALLSDLTICNYMSYLFAVGTTSWESATLAGVREDPDAAYGVEEESNEGMWHRPLLILDEAHHAESVILDRVRVTVDGRALPFAVDWPMPEATNTNGCFAWLELFSQLAETIDLKTLSKSQAKKMKKIQRRANFALAHRDAEAWIGESIKDRPGFVLKPMTVKSFAGQLFTYGNKVLLMSATILDANKVAESLGITEFDYVVVPSPFPAKNREVHVGNLNMRSQYLAKNWPTALELIESALEFHANEKGLILCSSNKMADEIFEQISAHRHRFIVARGETRLEEYERHVAAKGPSVLLVAGFWEGADLKDDLSRFQIIPSCPRPQWTGQVRARGDKDKVWYRLQTYSKLIQGCGRSIRSETDYAVTYCLDGELREEAERPDSLLPQWFREALIYVA